MGMQMPTRMGMRMRLSMSTQPGQRVKGHWANNAGAEQQGNQFYHTKHECFPFTQAANMQTFQ